MKLKWYEWALGLAGVAFLTLGLVASITDTNGQTDSPLPPGKGDAPRAPRGVRIDRPVPIADYLPTPGPERPGAVCGLIYEVDKSGNEVLLGGMPIWSEYDPRNELKGWPHEMQKAAFRATLANVIRTAGRFAGRDPSWAEAVVAEPMTLLPPGGVGLEDLRIARNPGRRGQGRRDDGGGPETYCWCGRLHTQGPEWSCVGGCGACYQCRVYP